MKNYNLVIDLGSTNTVIYKKGLGVVLKEPTRIALISNGKTKNIKYVGVEAYRLQGKTSESLEVIEPVVDGVVINKQLTVLMLAEFLRRAGINNLSRQKAVFLIPAGLSAKEKDIVFSVGYALNFGSIALLPTVFPSLIAMGANLHGADANMCIVMGGGITDMAIVSGGNIIRGGSLTISGSTVNLAISKYLRDNYYLMATQNVVEDIKLHLVSLLKNDNAKLTVSGLDGDTKTLKNVQLNSKELYPVIEEIFDHFADTINTLLNMSSGEVIADITRFGIYVCGGLANITGLERFLRERLNYAVFLHTEPSFTVMQGVDDLINDMALLNDLVIEK